MIKGGGDGVYSPEMLDGAGFPAAEGWYATIAAPNLLGEPDSRSRSIKEFATKYGTAAGRLLDHRL